MQRPRRRGRVILPLIHYRIPELNSLDKVPCEPRQRRERSGEMLSHAPNLPPRAECDTFSRAFLRSATASSAAVGRAPAPSLKLSMRCEPGRRVGEDEGGLDRG